MFVRSKFPVQLMISPLVAVSLVFISFFGVTRFETPGWVLQSSCYSCGFLSGGSGSLNCRIEQCDATTYATRPLVSSQHVCIFGLTVSIPFLYLLLFQPSYTFSSFISFLWWSMILGSLIFTLLFGNLKLRSYRRRSYDFSFGRLIPTYSTNIPCTNGLELL
jgi:hypothetical protein